jgi:hypothetical protein
MSSIVAGVTEEAAFRGYMQGPIERRYGLAAAILVSGTAFGLLHFPNHPADVLVMLPYYIAGVGGVWRLTWAANSILPALVLHSGGDVISLGRLWMTGPARVATGGVAAGVNSRNRRRHGLYDRRGIVGGAYWTDGFGVSLGSSSAGIEPACPPGRSAFAGPTSSAACRVAARPDLAEVGIIRTTGRTSGLETGTRSGRIRPIDRG